MRFRVRVHVRARLSVGQGVVVVVRLALFEFSQLDLKRAARKGHVDLLSLWLSVCHKVRNATNRNNFMAPITSQPHNITQYLPTFHVASLAVAFEFPTQVPHVSVGERRILSGTEVLEVRLISDLVELTIRRDKRPPNHAASSTQACFSASVASSAQRVELYNETLLNYRKPSCTRITGNFGHSSRRLHFKFLQTKFLFSKLRCPT